jgi:uncharacterized protein CbrC (UPF0167 family)
MQLPSFVYHPEPISTGNIVPAKTECKVCGQNRGFIYTGPVYAKQREELDNSICPWCIADGSAHKKFNAEFTDPAGVGNYGFWKNVPIEIIEKVAFQTPGFSGWQQEVWFTHCNDAAAFLGRVGYKELKDYGEEAINSLKEETRVPEKYWLDFLQALDKDGSPTAYLFKCIHCGKFGGYTDAD